MTKLSVNLNKIALLRNQRDLDMPSVTAAANICIEAGAHGITVHPRPDERHIRRSDVEQLAESIAGRVEFNIEGYPSAEFLELVCRVRPTQCTLVPDSPEQRTSDHGWDVRREQELLRRVVAELKEAGVRVSLFLDADPALPAPAAETGADRIELYTEPYARAFAEGRGEEGVVAFAETAGAAHDAGLGVNAGHDLNLLNLGFFLEAVPGVLEVSIGHALTADALEFGLGEAVHQYLHVIAGNTPPEVILSRSRV